MILIKCFSLGEWNCIIEPQGEEPGNILVNLTFFGRLKLNEAYKLMEKRFNHKNSFIYIENNTWIINFDLLKLKFPRLKPFQWLKGTVEYKPGIENIETNNYSFTILTHTINKEQINNG